MAFDPINQERLNEIRQRLTAEFDKPIPDSAIRKAMPGVTYRRAAMIELSKLNGTKFTLNCELIETLEETPDTVIMLVTGRKYIVTDSIDDILKKTVAYKRTAGLSIDIQPQSE